MNDVSSVEQQSWDISDLQPAGFETYPGDGTVNLHTGDSNNDASSVGEYVAELSRTEGTELTEVLNDASDAF